MFIENNLRTNNGRLKTDQLNLKVKFACSIQLDCAACGAKREGRPRAWHPGINTTSG